MVGMTWVCEHLPLGHGSRQTRDIIVIIMIWRPGPSSPAVLPANLEVNARSSHHVLRCPCEDEGGVNPIDIVLLAVASIRWYRHPEQ
jgi:hypothetical protein